MERKEKVIKILKALWLAVASVLSIVFIIACIVGGVSNKKQKESVSACVENDIIAYNINNDINKGIKKSVINPSTQAVIYDDNEYTIRFTANELNNYVWNNFNDTLFNQNFNEGSPTNDIILDIVFYRDDNTSTLLSIVSGAYGNTNNFSYFKYHGQGQVVGFNFVDNTSTPSQSNKFILVSNTIDHSFSNNITLEFDEHYYNDFKAAIELDIQANQPVSINESVFETLSSSTVGFIGTISSGITSIMAVFYAENTLTVIGKLSVIVVAVGLTYFLFRLIIGLVRMRG